MPNLVIHKNHEREVKTKNLGKNPGYIASSLKLIIAEAGGPEEI